MVQFLCERGLAFRGRDEIVGSNWNGNYLDYCGVILSGYDTFLTEHWNKCRRHTSYLSSTIYEEVITIMGVIRSSQSEIYTVGHVVFTLPNSLTVVK